MKLLLKFNLIYLLVCALGLSGAALVARNLLQLDARAEVADGARLVMDAAGAVAGYTSAQVAPLLADQLDQHFLPQSVPSYSAAEVVSAIARQRPEYGYKPAALNPTNPRDRAEPWEAALIERFRHDNSLGELVEERERPGGGRLLHIARPVRVNDAACLRCHDTALAAPASLIEKYGAAGGFGWRLGEVVGARIVSLPMAVPLERAEHAWRVVVRLLAALLLAIGLALNLMLWRFVLRPVSRLSAFADRVSLGELDAPDYVFRGRDEIGVLSASIARMRRSLVHALRLLDH